MKLEINPLQRPSHDTSHDRLCVLRDAHRTLIALADGMDSHEAAQAAAARTVAELARCFRSGVLPQDPRDWVMILEGIDHAVLADPDAGETSALVMLVQQGVVMGASVGDSLAYVVRCPGEANSCSAPASETPSGSARASRPRSASARSSSTASSSPVAPLESRLVSFGPWWPVAVCRGASRSASTASQDEFATAAKAVSRCAT